MCLQPPSPFFRIHCSNGLRSDAAAARAASRLANASPSAVSSARGTPSPSFGAYAKTQFALQQVPPRQEQLQHQQQQQTQRTPHPPPHPSAKSSSQPLPNQTQSHGRPAPIATGKATSVASAAAVTASTKVSEASTVLYTTTIEPFRPVSVEGIIGEHGTPQQV